MLKLVFLTKKFYDTYASCPQIEQKETRPYIRVQVMINGVMWAIPLRSNINHEYAIWTDKDNKCGIDVTKAVVIENPNAYISADRPYMRKNEFEVLKTIDQHTVVQKFQKHIKDYKKAKTNPKLKRNKNILDFSTLQYFEKYI